jgi:hypothetical protein
MHPQKKHGVPRELDLGSPIAHSPANNGTQNEMSKGETQNTGDRLGYKEKEAARIRETAKCDDMRVSARRIHLKIIFIIRLLL